MSKIQREADRVLRLVARQTTDPVVSNDNNNDDLCVNGFGDVVPCHSSWYSWGRWVALVLVVLGFMLLFCLCSIVSARRRRRRGLQPMYGTGWTGRTPWGHGPATYNAGYNSQYQQPYGGYPQQGGYYAPPPTYQQSNDNRGYFGGNQGAAGQESGIEMQPPQRVYRDESGKK